MRPTFADPRTDFVFKRVFGSEDHKDILVAFLNDLLELDEARRIVAVTLLSADQRPNVAELKQSIVDVKCHDAMGTTYVVEMQVLNVEGFEKRVLYNVTKAYTNQLAQGGRYPRLNDVVGVTICDFELWPRAQGSKVPMLSRWRMHETHSGDLGLSQIQLVFLELPKLETARPPRTMVEKWAYFFREAGELRAVPDVLREPAIELALDAARAATFTEDEWDAYIRAGMAIQDERGALTMAERAGKAAGEALGKAAGLRVGIGEVGELTATGQASVVRS